MLSNTVSTRKLVRCWHGPRSLHPPHGKRVAQSLVSHVAAACHFGVQLVALQNLAEKINVPCRELKRLNFAKFVGGQSRDDFPQRRECLVEWLRPLSLAYVSHDPLRLKVLKRLWAAAALFPPFPMGRAIWILPTFPARSSFPPTSFLLPVELLFAVTKAVHWRLRGAGILLHRLFLKHHLSAGTKDEWLSFGPVQAPGIVVF